MTALPSAPRGSDTAASSTAASSSESREGLPIDPRALVRALAATDQWTEAADAWWAHLWDDAAAAELMFLTSIEANRPAARGDATAAQVRLAEFNAKRLEDARAAVEGLLVAWGAAS